MTRALLVAAWAVPLALLAACLSTRVRARMPGWLWLAPLPGLAAALLACDAPPLVFDDAGLRLTLDLDPASATLLGVAALLWTGAGVYARHYLASDPRGARFAEWWLPTLAGSLGVFLAADLFTFYVAYALVSLPAWGLVAHDDTTRSQRAGALYLALAVVGEICLLLGFALLAAAAPGDTLAARDVVGALATAPARHFALAFLLVGFGLKIGLVPLHVWMPLAYSAAPHPAAAVLSGAAVKAGVIGLLRFLPFEVALPGWGGALAAAGLFSAFYGVAVGVTQRNPKAVLAYSSVSQMGGIAAILGMGLAAGDASAVPAASLTAAHHVLVKGALFLALGVAAVGGSRLAVLAPAAVLSLALAGLPLTGGSAAKLAAKAPLGDGLVGTLGSLAAAGTALLMLHFVARLAAEARAAPRGAAPMGLVAPWLLVAAAALAVPWGLAAPLAGVDLPDTLAPGALIDAVWPIALGAALAFGLQRLGARLPRVPEGDVLALGTRAARAGRAAADVLERVDRRLREWPVAGLSLLALAVALFAAMLGAS